jgi:hypothetical protein
MPGMAGMEPGERRDPASGDGGRRLERAPGERYATASATGTRAEDGSARAALTAPLLKAIVVAIVGAAALFAVGAVFASTAGLLFVAGLAGGAIGLLLARAAVPGTAAEPVLPRRRVTWLGVGVALAMIVAGALLTWLYALGEGGTLGFVDYLLETFGPFIPGELVIAALAAAWGVGAGPVQG